MYLCPIWSLYELVQVFLFLVFVTMHTYCSFVELADITIYFRVYYAMFGTLRVQYLLSSEHSKSYDVAGLHAICGAGVLCPIPAFKIS